MMSRDAVGSGALPEPESDGARLVRDYCGQCHGVPAPDAHVAANWPPVVQRMVVLMKRSGRAVPADTELRSINEYLQRHAR